MYLSSADKTITYCDAVIPSKTGNEHLWQKRIPLENQGNAILHHVK